MNTEHLSACLLLSRQTAVEPLLVRRLLRHFRAPAAIFAAPDQQLLELGLRPGQRAALAALAEQLVCPGAALQADLNLVQQRQLRVLALADPDYPALLQEIHDPPPILFVCGDPMVLGRPMLAMVGSRNCSAQAAENAFVLARDLAAAGMVIVSGMALGIDAAAHRGALAGGGETVAVLGAGIDVVYPRRHHRLYREIATQGAVISEFSPGAPPLPGQFPTRNRIISGLSLGVIVVEAALKSGSLTTAASAVSQNREVFAMPGSIHNPRARGCHALLRQGATLIESVADILPELQGWQAPAPPAAALSPAQQQLLALIGDEPTPLALLAQRRGEPVEQLLPVLLELELADLIRREPGGYQRRHGAVCDH